MRKRSKFVEIDVAAFRHALKTAGYDTLEEASTDLLGKHRSYLHNLVKRRECSIFTLDNVAVKLNQHVSQLVVGDLYDVGPEDWPDLEGDPD